MIAAFLLTASAPAVIVAAPDPMDRVVEVGPKTLQDHTLKLVTYRCRMNNIEGSASYAVEFSRKGGQAFLTGNDRIPIGRTRVTVDFTKNESPFPLEQPSRIFASDGQTMMSYDNPGYVAMSFNAVHSYQSELSFLVQTSEPKDVRLALRGKCEIEEESQSPTAIDAVAQ
jgi:hypothetical protein